jgi:hypothetical protein
MRRLILCLLWPVIFFGQELEILGYFEPQVTGMRLSDKFYQVSSNKLRLDFQKDLSDRISFGANVNYITYHGKTNWAIVDYLPTNIVNTMPEFQKNMLIFNFGDMVQSAGPLFVHRPDRIYLDNAYMKMTFKYTDVTLGRQQISLGTGYTWNPTDLFNTKDILDPTYEQPGHNAIRFDFPTSTHTTLTAIYSPDEEWKNSTKLLKYKFPLGHFDISGIFIDRYWTFTDYTALTSNIYKRQMFGGDIAGELFGLGVWTEIGYNKLSLKKGYGLFFNNFVESVVGLDYTFSSGLYIMSEFYKNTMAPTEWHDYTLNSWMWYLSAEVKTIGRDQLLAMFQYPITNLITIGCLTITSLNDNSSAIVPTLNYSIFEDVEMIFYGNFYIGSEGKSFSSNLGNGGMLRFRVYF